MLTWTAGQFTSVYLTMKILILLSVLTLCASQNVESSWYFPRSAMLRQRTPLLRTLIVSIKVSKLRTFNLVCSTPKLITLKYFSKPRILWNFCKEPWMKWLSEKPRIIAPVWLNIIWVGLICLAFNAVFARWPLLRVPLWTNPRKPLNYLWGK